MTSWLDVSLSLIAFHSCWCCASLTRIKLATVLFRSAWFLANESGRCASYIAAAANQVRVFGRASYRMDAMTSLFRSGGTSANQGASFLRPPLKTTLTRRTRCFAGGQSMRFESRPPANGVLGFVVVVVVSRFSFHLPRFAKWDVVSERVIWCRYFGTAFRPSSSGRVATSRFAFVFPFVTAFRPSFFLFLMLRHVV